ncbi:MAG: glycoside hydrolase family 5 protein [Acetatifactor sp.]
MSTAMDFVKNIRAGISIGDTLDAFKDDIKYEEAPENSETAWGNPVIQEGLIDSILASGFNLIRIPVSWRKHIGASPEFHIEDRWMNRVQQVVDYVYRKGAYVILNLHHEDWNYPYYDNLEAACTKMRAVWNQIASRFEEYDEHLIFEGQNEPRKIGTPLEWNGGDEEGWAVVNATNQAFVDTVRKAGGHNSKRFLMVPGYAANCTVGIRKLTVPRDERVMVSVHAYEPYEFALQLPGRTTWNHDTAMIDSIMKELKELYVSKGIPVIMGEFGAMNRENNEEERAAWVAYYVSKAREAGIPCVWWDNARFEGEGELFGLFDRYHYQCVFPKVLNGFMKGLE